MAIEHNQQLASSRVFGCAKCKTHLSTVDELISTKFNGQHGRAILFESVVNIRLGQQVDREMLTGLHTVRDIHCGKCDATLGWKYVSLYRSLQQAHADQMIAHVHNIGASTCLNRKV
ncbi:hypothetical protein U1Q18_044723 [Sarracenia purpurea var. burkii]